MATDTHNSSGKSSGQRAATGHPLKKPPRYRSNLAPFISTFLILFVFWSIFSGKFDLFHITLGIASCLIVAAISGDLFFSTPLDRGLFMCWIRFGRYIPWLLYQVFLANLYLLYLTFHPRMSEKIDPHIITFDSHLKSDVARTTFANSITLTPGTITVSVNVMGGFSVHCIDRSSGQDLPGEMERRVGVVFKE